MVTVIPIQKPQTCTRSITSCFNQAKKEKKKNPTHMVQNQTPCCKFTEISYHTENSQDFVCHCIQFILPPKVSMHGTVHVKSQKIPFKKKKLVNVLPETSAEVSYNTVFCTTFLMDKFHKKDHQRQVVPALLNH